MGFASSVQPTRIFAFSKTHEERYDVVKYLSSIWKTFFFATADFLTVFLIVESDNNFNLVHRKNWQLKFFAIVPVCVDLITTSWGFQFPWQSLWFQIPSTYLFLFVFRETQIRNVFDAKRKLRGKAARQNLNRIVVHVWSLKKWISFWLALPCIKWSKRWNFLSLSTIYNSPYTFALFCFVFTTPVYLGHFRVIQQQQQQQQQQNI